MKWLSIDESYWQPWHNPNSERTRQNRMQQNVNNDFELPIKAGERLRQHFFSWLSMQLKQNVRDDVELSTTTFENARATIGYVIPPLPGCIGPQVNWSVWNAVQYRIMHHSEVLNRLHSSRWWKTTEKRYQIRWKWLTDTSLSSRCGDGDDTSWLDKTALSRQQNDYATSERNICFSS